MILTIIDAALIALSYCFAFLLAIGVELPEHNFLPFRESLAFLVLIHILSLAYFKVYHRRHKSFWDLFKKCCTGMLIGTFLSFTFVYIFRERWLGFPTSVFLISFLTSLLLVFVFNTFYLMYCNKIKKKVVIIGDKELEDFTGSVKYVEKIRIDKIEEIIEHQDIDEVVICKKIQDSANLNLLLYLLQKLGFNILFDPVVYLDLLQTKFANAGTISSLNTFLGRKSEGEEFLIRSLDIIGSVLILVVCAPLILAVCIAIKVTSSGPLLYKQERVGKDGKTFTLYKFRTMKDNAEKHLGPVLASTNDHRITKVGDFLRRTHLDELPQLFDVIQGHMSLVGPRPERPHFVQIHKALQGLRLAVKPGLTGIAQVRGFYDLSPRHKIKYDFLYIQNRSFLLNISLLAKTLPVVLSRKGQ